MYFIVISKKNIIVKEIIIVKINTYIGNHYYYLGLPEIRVGWACTTKIMLPLPKPTLEYFLNPYSFGLQIHYCH